MTRWASVRCTTRRPPSARNRRSRWQPPPPQCYYAVPLDIAVEVARVVNDGIAEFVAQRPDRLEGFGTVPMPDGNEAARELERCATRLGFKGVQVLTNVNGKELWRTPRADVPTWSTPVIHEVDGRTQIIVNGWRHTGAYDFKTGQEIWKLNGGGDIPVPVPVAGHGLVFITNAHGGQSPVLAIRESATGEIQYAKGTASPATRSGQAGSSGRP